MASLLFGCFCMHHSQRFFQNLYGVTLIQPSLLLGSPEYVCRSTERGTLSGFLFLVLLMIIKLDFKRFNMLFLDSCQPSQFFLYNFLKIENLSRFQIKQLRKWTLNNRVLRASTRTKCVFNKTEVSHLFHTIRISLIPVMQSRSAMWR